MAKYGDVIELIAKRLGLTAEETMEKLGKKIPAAAEETSDATILKNLSDEAKDITQPLGSGKNLDALSRAKEEASGMYDSAATAKMQRDVMNAPFVDTGYDISTPVSQYKGVGSADYGLVPAKTPDFLTPKVGQQASQAAPLSLANTAESLKGSVDDVLAPAGSKLIKPAAVVGLGAAGYGLMSGNNQKAQASKSLVPESPVKAIEPKTPEQLKVEAKKTVKTEAPKIDGLDFDALSKKFDEEMTSLPQGESQFDEFELARRAAEDNLLYANLGKAASGVGSAIASLGAGSQVKLDASGFDDLAKAADRPMTQLQAKQKHQQVKAELNDDKAMRDPNSEISRMVTGIAQKVGILKPGQSASAMDLKNAGVNLGTLLATIEAGNARRDAAALAREGRLSEKESKIEAKKEEESIKRQDKRKLITEEVEDRYRNLNDSLDQLDSLVKEHGTVEVFGSQNEDMNRLLDTVATDMAKYTDPSSVARPAEVALWRRNLIETGLTGGGLGMRNSTARDIIKNFKGEVEKRRAHAYKVRGITPDGAPTRSNDTGVSFPMQVKNAKGQMATVSNEQELKEAQAEGFN